MLRSDRLCRRWTRCASALSNAAWSSTSAAVKHLLIQLQRDDSLDTVACLTETARNHYGAAFRTQSGRWEPLPAAGDLRSTAKVVVSLLAPYLEP